MDSLSPVISFTFDDFPCSALRWGGRILEERGLSATYYASIGLMNTESPVGRIFSAEDLAEVLARGHELGCHTFDHCHAWHTDPQYFEDSILRNREALNRLLPGASFATFSYPRSIPRPEAKKKAEKYFQCCRGGGYHKINCGRVDLNFLDAHFLEQGRGNPTTAKGLIDQNSKRGGWLIFATHDISENPTKFGCTPAFFSGIVRSAVESGAVVLPVARAIERIQSPSSPFGRDPACKHPQQVV